MVPTWLSKLLEALPGRPAWHIAGLMLIVFMIEAASHILNSSMPLTILDVIVFIFVIRLDFLMMMKELVDMRDWVVVRSITASFWVAFALWLISHVLVQGFTSWMSYIDLIIGLLVLGRDGLRFVRVITLVKDIPSWKHLALIKRRDVDGI